MSTKSSSKQKPQPETSSRSVPVITYHQTQSFEGRYGTKLPQVVRIIESILAFLLSKHDRTDEMGLLAGRLKFSIAFFSAPNQSWFPGRNLIVGHAPSTAGDGFDITIRLNGILFKGCLKLEPVHLPHTQRIHQWIRDLAGNKRELRKAEKWRDLNPATSSTKESGRHVELKAPNPLGAKSGFPIISSALEVAALQPPNGHVAGNNRGTTVQPSTRSTDRLTGSPTRAR
jgi:hypothetical protein